MSLAWLVGAPSWRSGARYSGGPSMPSSRAGAGPRGAKVEQFAEPALRLGLDQEDVLALDVAVQDRAAVDEAHRVGDLPQDIARDLGRDLAVLELAVDG